jgi:hypothetical protein
MKLVEQIQRALTVAGNTHTIADVVEMCSAGRLYPFHSDNSIVILEVVQYPRKRVCNVFLAAGDLKEITGMQDILEDFAKKRGCDSITVPGRFGWDKILPALGFTNRWVIHHKDIKE